MVNIRAAMLEMTEISEPAKNEKAADAPSSVRKKSNKKAMMTRMRQKRYSNLSKARVA